MLGEPNPLILVFYIDRATITNTEFMGLFSDSVNEYIQRMDANIMAFFIPTDREERVECINPVQLEKPDMDRVNKLVNDIAIQFSMDKPEDVRDYSFLNKKDCAYSFREKIDYLFVDSSISDENIDDYRIVRVATKINFLAHKLASACRVKVKNLRMHSCFKPLIDNILKQIDVWDYNIDYDDSLETDVIFVYSEQAVNSEYIFRTTEKEFSVISIKEATDAEIKEYKMRSWGYLKIENYEESDRV